MSIVSCFPIFSLVARTVVSSVICSNHGPGGVSPSLGVNRPLQCAQKEGLVRDGGELVRFLSISRIHVSCSTFHHSSGAVSVSQVRGVDAAHEVGALFRRAGELFLLGLVR